MVASLRSDLCGERQAQIARENLRVATVDGGNFCVDTNFECFLPMVIVLAVRARTCGWLGC